MKNTYVLSSTTSKKLSSTLLVALLFFNTSTLFAKERNPFEAPKNSRFYNQNDITLISNEQISSKKKEDLLIVKLNYAYAHESP